MNNLPLSSTTTTETRGERGGKLEIPVGTVDEVQPTENGVVFYTLLGSGTLDQQRPRTR